MGDGRWDREGIYELIKRNSKNPPTTFVNAQPPHCRSVSARRVCRIRSDAILLHNGLT